MTKCMVPGHRDCAPARALWLSLCHVNRGKEEAECKEGTAAHKGSSAPLPPRSQQTCLLWRPASYPCHAPSWRRIARKGHPGGPSEQLLLGGLCSLHKLKLFSGIPFEAFSHVFRAVCKHLKLGARAGKAFNLSSYQEHLPERLGPGILWQQPPIGETWVSEQWKPRRSRGTRSG